MSESSSTKLRYLTWVSLPVFCDMMIFRFQVQVFRSRTVGYQFFSIGTIGGWSYLKRVKWVMWFKFCPVLLRRVSGMSIINVKTTRVPFSLNNSFWGSLISLAYWSSEIFIQVKFKLCIIKEGAAKQILLYVKSAFKSVLFVIWVCF